MTSFQLSLGLYLVISYNSIEFAKIKLTTLANNRPNVLYELQVRRWLFRSAGCNDNTTFNWINRFISVVGGHTGRLRTSCCERNHVCVSWPRRMKPGYVTFASPPSRDSCFLFCLSPSGFVAWHPSMHAGGKMRYILHAVTRCFAGVAAIGNCQYT